MNNIDYTIAAIYLIGLLLMGFVLRKQTSKQDYFLAGRSLGWKPLSLSIMATRLSAVSFISAPAFVGLREGGGLVWLSYELALPLAMLLLLYWILPALYRSGVVSVYDFLEQRFGRSTRLLISMVFQISRSCHRDYGLCHIPYFTKHNGFSFLAKCRANWCDYHHLFSTRRDESSCLW